MEKKEFKCEICGKTFKSESGLSGHMRFSHNEQRIKSTPDRIAERLEVLELAGAKNPGQKVDTLEGLVTTLRLLLPAMAREKIVVIPFGSRYDNDYEEFKRYRIIKNPGFTKAGFGGLVVGTGAEEL